MLPNGGSGGGGQGNAPQPSSGRGGFEDFILQMIQGAGGTMAPGRVNIITSAGGMTGGAQGGIPMFSNLPFGFVQRGNATPNRSSTAPAATTSQVSPGSVYRGELPPTAWIQREQQRMPMQFSATGAPNLDATRLREEGNRAFKDGNFDLAVEHYTHAIEVEPNSEFNYTNRSFAYFKLARFRDSANDAKEAIRLNSNFYKAHYRLGLALTSLGEYVQAKESLHKALSLAPGVNKESIRVAIAKCNSKMARAPVTPLITDVGASELGYSRPASAFLPSLGVTMASVVPEGPVDYDALTSLVQETAVVREECTTYEDAFRDQQSVVEFKDRTKRIRDLMGVATTNKLTALSKDAAEKQENLRRAVNEQDCGAYYAAKKDRDDAYAAVWSHAAQVEEAIKTLKSIAGEEQEFFRRFGDAAGHVPKQGAIALNLERDKEKEPAVPLAPSDAKTNIFRRLFGAVVSPSEASSSSPPLSQEKAPEATADPEGAEPSSPITPSSAMPNIERLLRRREEIHDSVKKVQKCFEATDAAAELFRRAMEKETAMVRDVATLLVEAKGLDAQLNDHARRIAQATTNELSTDRLEALEQVNGTVQRIKEDEESFRKTSTRGDELLEEEAKLEQQRLILERQRIQLQAEVEWFKVRDEPEAKVVSLQNHIKTLQHRIGDTHEKQKTVQKDILSLVQGNHPELAWKSMASGSRILRLVKGSGLWANLSFSDFQIVSTLSSTVNSKVYHATRRGEHFALKEIPVDDEKARRRFQREVNIVAGCNHPNVIRIMSVFFDGPFAYLLLPYYPRGNLKSLMAKPEAMPWVSVQDLFRQIATAVAYLHERGVVHADIKPSNILISSDGRPVIADFGIAKDHGELAQTDITVTVTNAGSSPLAAAGTARYMAPEQNVGGGSPADAHRLSGEKSDGSGHHGGNSPGGPKGATCMSDMWALGVTMFDVAKANASVQDPDLTPMDLPPLLPNMPRIEIPSRMTAGDEKLADAISSLLTANPDNRPTAYELLAHPYFGSICSAVSTSQRSEALARSDERIDAVRSYIHAVRSSHPQKVLVSVSRNQMVASLRDIFHHLDPEDILGPIMVVFQGEAGIDEGALTTEMLNLFYEQIISQRKALVFAHDEADAMANSPSVVESEEVGQRPTVLFNGANYLPAPDDAGVSPGLFRLLGMVLLKSIVENRPIPIQLNSAVLKSLCGVSPTLADLEEYDQALAESLKRLRLLSSEDLANAELDFSHFSPSFLETQWDAKYTTESRVTTSNVRDYIDLRVQYDLVECRKQSLLEMKIGFFCVPSMDPHLKLLSPSDLLLLLCGQQHISAQAIVDSLEFQGFDAASNTPALLKEVLMDMSQNNLRRFLQLCTTTASLPANGSTRAIKVLKCADVRRLPVGHGCVNQLDLPDYNDRQVIQEKLEVALAHASDGFHLV